MSNNLGNVINYCRNINGSIGFNDMKTQLQSEMTQDYNEARPNAIYRFNVLVNSIDGKDVYVNDSETPIRGVIDISKKQTADTEMEERLQVYPNLIKRGDYVKFKINDTDELRTYLIKSKIDKKHGYDEGIFEECNYDVKFIVDNTLYTIPAIVTNNTKYTLGVKDINNSFIEANGMFGFVAGFNEISKLIHLDQRFIVNGQAWKATQTDYSSEKGVISILLGETAINYEIDDVINEVANGLILVPHTYTYNIPTTFELTNGTSANLVYSIKDENGNEIDYSGVTVTSDSTLISITNTNGVITIKGLSIGIGSIKLTSTLSTETKEFDIAFEVKETVVNQVDYQYSFSQPITALKQYVTTTLATSKLINGIVDSSLKIAYVFDSVGQSLISSNKLVVTVKSDSSISIKNSGVTVPTDIYLTVSDSANDTLILNSQKITLTGM